MILSSGSIWSLRTISIEISTVVLYSSNRQYINCSPRKGLDITCLNLIQTGGSLRRQRLKVEGWRLFSCCWCLMGTGWPLSSAGMVEAWVGRPSVFFISYPSDSMADCGHSSPDSLSAGQMLIVFIIGSYVNARTYPVSLFASHLMCVSALMLSPQCLVPSSLPALAHLSTVRLSLF